LVLRYPRSQTTPTSDCIKGRKGHANLGLFYVGIAKFAKAISTSMKERDRWRGRPNESKGESLGWKEKRRAVRSNFKVRRWGERKENDGDNTPREEKKIFFELSTISEKTVKEGGMHGDYSEKPNIGKKVESQKTAPQRNEDSSEKKLAKNLGWRASYGLKG